MTRTPNATQKISGNTGRTDAQRFHRKPLVLALAAIGLCNSQALWAAPTPHVSLINARTDDASVVSGNAQVIDVLANDAGVDASQLMLIDPTSGSAVTNITTAAGGQISVTADNKLLYTPNSANEEYSDNFEYQVVEQEWRGSNSVAATVLDRGAPANVTDDGAGDAISDAGTIGQQLWPYTGNDQVRYQGILVGLDATFETCRSNDSNEASISTSLVWGLQKRGGGANSYEASITHNSGGSLLYSPLAASGNARSDDWTAISTRNLQLDLTGLSEGDYQSLAFGLYVENFDSSTGENSWDSLSQTASVTSDTSGCALDSTKVAVSVTVDTDSDDDGVPNASDEDEDNDGIPNNKEGGDQVPPLDSDGDGIPNKRDLDSDNDGVWDIGEAGGSAYDADNNGVVDDFIDENNDGYDDDIAAAPLPLPDSDNDQFADYIDLDSDNDGLGDIVESGGTDTDSDGKVDQLSGGSSARNVGGGLRVIDFDGDGVPNHADTDRDNDGIPDLHEAGGKDRYDSNSEGVSTAIAGNGVVDRMENNNGNPVLDSVEVTAQGADGSDADGDLVDDAFDPDSGATGLDADGDGQLRIDDGDNTPSDADTGDPDDNNNGFDDRFEGNSLPNQPVDNDPPGGGSGGTIKTGTSGAGPFGPLLIAALAFVAGLRRRIAR